VPSSQCVSASVRTLSPLVYARRVPSLVQTAASCDHRLLVERGSFSTSCWSCRRQGRRRPGWHGAAPPAPAVDLCHGQQRCVFCWGPSAWGRPAAAAAALQMSIWRASSTCLQPYATLNTSGITSRWRWTSSTTTPTASGTMCSLMHRSRLTWPTRSARSGRALQRIGVCASGVNPCTASLAAAAPVPRWLSPPSRSWSKFHRSPSPPHPRGCRTKRTSRTFSAP
jgi:hypothetical protein